MENNNSSSIDNSDTASVVSTTSIVSMENVNQVASWVSSSVVTAFFNSLERFSCVNISTMDPDDDDDDYYEDEAKDQPLTLTNDSHKGDPVANLPV
ncbi:hypothetical protein Tsubulata_001138 [Turnera subulata]|uniref:Uncharacterized protein n=1 Tax=Turnera subulata TaxID=218843 RepID=A0A9Q0JFN3_9ROSI|nr:hypothetical protein Tsubulata_001138 [Turnera subulata]